MGKQERIGDWLQTYLGRAFWPLDPRADEVDIEDIAHALSCQCRFGGHCLWFYSVAEHSLLVSQVVPAPLALVGLMHDAAEAYVADVPRPLKRFLSGYATAEQKVWEAIAERFGLPNELPEEVKAADDAVLLAESSQVMGPKPIPWALVGEPANVLTKGLNPEMAERLFLDRFYELYV